MAGSHRINKNCLFILHFAILCIFCSGCDIPSISPWESLASLQVGVVGNGLVVMDDKLTIIGGTYWDDGQKYWSDSIWQFDSSSNSWNLAAKLSSPYANGVAVVMDNKLVLISGSHFKTTTRRNIEILDNEFRLQKSYATNDIFLFSSYSQVGDKVYIISGRGNSDINHYKVRQTSLYTANFIDGNVEIKKYSILPGLPRIFCVSAFCKDSVYVFGGLGYDVSLDKFYNLSEAYRYVILEDKWVSLSSLPYNVRAADCCVLDHRWILIIGGCRDYTPTKEGACDTIIVYDTKSNRYVAEWNMPEKIITSAILHDDYLVIVSGEPAPATRSNKVYRAKLKR